jgi:murein DD-endopeptidase MepM/ murein hydrolase activator NlpD
MPNKSDTTHTGPRSSRFNLKDGEQGSVKAGKRNIVRSLSASRTRNIGISFVGLLLVGLLIWLASGGRGIPNALAAVDEAPANNKAETEVVTSQISLEDLPVFTSGVNGYPGPQRRVNIHTIVPDRPRMEIITYSVTQGDSIFAIAEKFALKPETILWGNYDTLQDDPHGLRPGQELNILPVDGTYYEWNEGDNFEAVAAFFGVEAREVIDWPGNNLPPALNNAGQDLPAGTGLVIPGGERELVSWQAPRISRSNPAVAKVAGPGACGSIYDGPIGEGFFLWPTPATYLSGYGYSSIHPGIDIGGATGNAIFASASGVVVYAGWNNYGYGYMVVIDHGDGWQSLYAHMNLVNVGCGQAVYQGNVIGGVGSTGNSSGSHLHFELQHDTYGKVNPYDLVSP